MVSQDKIIEQLEVEILNLRTQLYDAVRERAIVRKKFNNLKVILNDMFPDMRET